MPIWNVKRMSIPAVAELVDVHKTTVWRWTTLGVRGRRLATRMIGGRRYILLEDLQAFLGEPEDSDEEQFDAADTAGKLLDAHGVPRR